MYVKQHLLQIIVKFLNIFFGFILEDISDKLCKQQYGGGKKDVGTEHLLVNKIDRVKKLLDNPDISAVGLCSYDWKGAFDQLDLV